MRPFWSSPAPSVHWCALRCHHRLSAVWRDVNLLRRPSAVSPSVPWIRGLPRSLSTSFVDGRTLCSTDPVQLQETVEQPSNCHLIFRRNIFRQKMTHRLSFSYSQHIFPRNSFCQQKHATQNHLFLHSAQVKQTQSHCSIGNESIRGERKACVASLLPFVCNPLPQRCRSRRPRETTSARRHQTQQPSAILLGLSTCQTLSLVLSRHTAVALPLGAFLLSGCIIRNSTACSLLPPPALPRMV